MSEYKLILGDSSEHIKKIADQSIDLILTDPPYNLGRYSTGNIKMSRRPELFTSESMDDESIASEDASMEEPTLFASS